MGFFVFLILIYWVRRKLNAALLLGLVGIFWPFCFFVPLAIEFSYYKLWIVISVLIVLYGLHLGVRRVDPPETKEYKFETIRKEAFFRVYINGVPTEILLGYNNYDYVIGKPSHISMEEWCKFLNYKYETSKNGFN